MRRALGASLALHASALTLAVVNIHTPEPLEARVQSVSVEVVPIEEFAAVMRGAEEAPLVNEPAPAPVEADPEPTEVVNVGETEVDVEVAEAAVTAPVPVEATPVPTAPEPDSTPSPEPFDIAAIPAPAERPTAPTPEVAEAAEPDAPIVPETVEAPEPTPALEPEPAPEPVEIAAAELEPVAEPADPVSDIVEQAVEAARQVESAETPAESEPVEPAPPVFAALPSGGPKALFRPARPATPRSPEPAEATPPTRSTPTEQGETNLADRVNDLINRETASAGGARRPTEQASLGGQQTNGAKLTRSELDGLRAHLQSCWSNPLTSFEESPVVKVMMRLNPDGTVNGRPQVLESSGSRIAKAIEGAGSRMLRRCGPYTMLPPDKHGGANGWNEVVVNFSLNSGVSVGG